jgi:hypothetical protein
VDLYDPGSGSRLHDFIGDFPGTPHFWTLRLPDESVVVEQNGRRLTLDATDVPVLDITPDQPTGIPATVSFHVVWKAKGAPRRLGKKKAPDGTSAAFSGRIRLATRATGTFSGAVGGFVFQSDLVRPAKSVFAELGTEQNGILRPGAAGRCVACAPAPGGTPGGW